MRLRSAASILLTLVFCTAENNEPRWSKPDGEIRQGEWVPLSDERLSPESSRAVSAINPVQFNHALRQNQPSTQFTGDFQQKPILAAQSAPPRIAFIHPQNINPQLALQQQQIPPQQVLSQFLNHQIGQSNIPIFSRALLPKQPQINSNFYPQQENINLENNYNPAQEFKNTQYNFGNEPRYESPSPYSEADNIPINPSGSIKVIQPTLVNEKLSKNFSSDIPNKKEEVQILYVPVEMLRQQERARNAARNNLKPTEIPEPQPHQEQGNQQQNTKESRKFRHPIQPLKEQVPAHHLRGSLSHSQLLGSELEDGFKDTLSNPNYQRTTLPPRSQYFDKQSARVAHSAASRNKEQYFDESNIQDDVSDFRNIVTRRTPQKESRERTVTTLPPPNQPPLSVFMESTDSNRIGDVLTLLKDSKTIPVLDSVGSDAPQVFVGPSNLNTPLGYIKYELPYLSSLNYNNAPQKLSQVPFFVAPLNFQPPPGFAKIPFPPPHIGSVVLSNATNEQFNNELNVPTPPTAERHTTNHKEPFTIPADISSISPQLPSLINSLQEDEYLGASSTESLTEPTEEPSHRYRRPNNSRRQNNRGSQRGYTSSSTTTRRPTSRQRKPTTRYFNQRVNENLEPITTPSTSDEHNIGKYQYHSNLRPETEEKPDVHYQNVNENQDYVSAEPHTMNQFPRNTDGEKEEQRHFNHNSGQSTNNIQNEPKAVLRYNTNENVHQNEGIPVFSNSPGRIQDNEHLNAQLFQDTRISEAHTHTINTQSDNFYHDNSQNYPAQQIHSSNPINNNFEQNAYQSASQSQIDGVQDSAGSLSGFEELHYKKASKDEIADPPRNQNFSHRAQDQAAVLESNVPSTGLHKTFHEQTHMQDDTISIQQQQEQQQHQSEIPTDKQQLNGYLDSFDAVNNSYGPRENSDDSYSGNLPTIRPTHQTSMYPQTTSQDINHNNQNNNYDVRNEPAQRLTERPPTIRSRGRVRGRIHNHSTQNQHNTPPVNYDEEEQKTTNYNKNSHNRMKFKSESHEDRPSYQTESNYHTTTELAPISSNRKYLHSRGRRPLRPTLSTTSSPTTTSTTTAPGTKYLIRTRRPTVPHTKLNPGRGRIRRPTTPSTTTLQTTTTTEYPRTAPQWRHPAENDDYLSKENYSPEQNSDEYRPPQYQDNRPSELRYKNPQRERDDNYHERRNNLRTRVEQSQRVPNYSYESEEEQLSTQKQYVAPTETTQYSTSFERSPKNQLSREYETTPQPHYAREYEKASKTFNSREYDTTQKTHSLKDIEETQKPHYVREYEATLKPQYPRDYDTTQKPYFSREHETTQKPHYFRDYETTQKLHYSREYETTQKPHYSREYERPQKSHYSEDYETTQKPHYSRDYETTQKPHYSRAYETTQKPHYSRDYETTQKPHFSRDYETTQKPHYSRDFETTQKPHFSREYDTTQKPYYSSEYEVTQTKKPYYSREYETTQKPQNTREYSDTANSQLYSQYDSPQIKQNNQNYESLANSQQISDFDTRHRDSYIKEYPTTTKPQIVNDHETTLSQSFQEYETTPKPYLNQEDSTKKSNSFSSPRSNHSHKRRPVGVTRAELKSSKYNKPESTTTKNSDSDFWNQAVTIQQSHSFVYNPDEDQPVQPPAQESSQTQVNSKTGQSLNDYDDFYSFQDGGQFSSDQSPFPSNDQHVTYTKAKPIEEIGKANQYPEKVLFDQRGLEEETEEEEKEIIQTNVEEQDKISGQSYSLPGSDGTSPVAEIEIPHANPPQNVEDTAEFQQKKSEGRKKDSKRRGTWVRVRVKKPKDVFETAESQRFSAVRENSINAEGTNAKVVDPKSHEFSTLNSAMGEVSPVQVEETTTVSLNTNANDENIIMGGEEEKSGYTTNKGPLVYSDTTIASTIRDFLDETEKTPTTTSFSIAQETTKVENSDYKTSTTTEISLETEICYKGQCIKTKRKKDKSDLDYPLVK